MKNVLTVCAAFALTAAVAHAQTRTWVSGVGNDANPCSRTAPCKTFAGAISKTSAGGEINVLDPGGFGAVTITKSITISSEGFEAGVLVSGTSGVIINALAGDRVVLRGLDFEGLGTGLDGVRVIGALNSLVVEKCTFNGFRGTNGNGINIAPTTAGTVRVFVTDTTIRNSGQGTGGGIFFNPSAGVTVKAQLSNVRLENNLFGVKAQGATNVTISDSLASSNAAAGFSAATSPASMTIERSTSAHNATGLVCAAGTTLRIGNLSLIDNTTALTTGGSCQSFLNNDADVAITVTPVNPQ